jgi:GNAT superfamily N-acetyltransferase
MELSVCVTDDDYEAWRDVRIAVVPGERCDTVDELRAQATPDRLMLLARVDGVVVGSGMASRSETAGGGFAAPRVLPGHRRRGIGSALLRALAEHVTALGLPKLRGMSSHQVLSRTESTSSRWTSNRRSGQPATTASASRYWPTSPPLSPSMSALTSGTLRGPATRCSWPCPTVR